MAHRDLQSVRDYYLQAIESYDIKILLREAENGKILKEAERNALERQRSRSSMRESFVSLMIKRGAQGRNFILDFSRRVHEQTQRQFDLVYEAMLPKPDDSHYVASINYAGSIEPGEGPSQLSQGSSSNSGSTSPMECDPEDAGYFSISGITSVCHSQPDNSHQPSCSSLDFMEEQLKKYQETHSDLRRHISRKQQRRLLTLSSRSPSQSSQAAPTPGTVNYVFNMLKVTSGSEKKGTNVIGYPGETSYSLSRLSACNDLSSSCNGSIQQWENSSWSRCLNEHHCRIIGLLDVTSLLPHLWEKHLLTPTERDELDSMHATPHKQARYLLKILPRKGEHGFKQFLECLRNEKDHMGHAELVKWLGLGSQIPIEV